MPTISGRVVFDVNRSAAIDGTDTGLANIPVVLQNTSTNQRLTVLTDANGNYSFINVPNGNYSITEAYGQSGGVSTPGNFASALVGPIPTGNDPPISFATNPPTGANNIDSLTPNTVFVTVAGVDLTNENFLDGPVIYTPIGSLLDSCTTIIPTNLITAADNGTFGTFPAGTAANTSAPGTAAIPPYPGVTPGFTYSTALTPSDGSYVIKNLMTSGGIFSGNVWWRMADHTVGDETGRFMAIGGSSPGATIFQSTVNVTPNTNYLFSAWIANLIRQNGYADPALGVVILDQSGNTLYQQTLGNQIPANLNAPEWKQLGTALNSGNNTQLTVRFISQGPSASGNDFTIDDVALQPISIPNLTPVKSISKSYADLLDTVIYTVTLTNTCTNTLTNVSFQDTIPQGLSFVSSTVSINGVTNTSLNPQTGFGGLTIPGGSSVVIKFTARVDTIPSPNNPTNNVANMRYSYSPVTGGIPVSYITTTNTVPLRVNTADLTSPGNLVKYVDKAFADIGDTITYTIVMKNTGTTSANNVSLIDNIPNDTAFVLNSITSSTPFTSSLPNVRVNLTNPIAPGQSVTITFKVTVTTMPNPNPIPNTASINYAYTVDPSIPNGATDSGNTNQVTTQVNHADLISAGNLVKYVDKAFADVGDTLTYTIVIRNTGNVPANNVSLIDTIPTDTTYVLNSISSSVTFISNVSNININLVNPIAPGESVTVTFKVTVNTIPNPNPIPNIASINYTYTVNPSIPNEKTASGNSNQVTTRVNHADLISAGNLLKYVDKAYATIGDTLTYTISIKNTGNVVANNVLLIDTIPNDTTYILNSTSSNVAFTNNIPNLSVSLTNPISPGESVTVTFKVTINTIPNPNPIPNTSSIDYRYTVDPSIPSISTSSGNSNKVTTQVNYANASMTKSSNIQTAVIGETITYTITITNTGSTTINPATVTDIIPLGTTYVQNSLIVSGVLSASNPATGINVSPLLAGQSKVIVYDVVVNNNFQTLPLSNIATIDYGYIVDPSLPAVSKEGKSNTANLNIANASIVKSVDKSYAQVGDILTYTNIITNTGNTTITNLIFTDTPPENTTYINPSIVVNGIIYPSITSTTDINLGTQTAAPLPLGPGNSISIQYKVTIDTIPNYSTIINTSKSNFEYIDSGQTKSSTINSNIVSTTISEGKIEITKNVDKSSVAVGDNITYTIVAKNIGNIDVGNVVITDTLPSQLTFISGSVISSGISKPISNPSSGINLGTIPAQSSSIVVISATVSTLPASGQISNFVNGTYVVVVSPSLPSITKETISNTVVSSVKQVLVTITKECSPKVVSLGDEIDYTFTISNNGNVDISNIKLYDTLPSNVSYVNGSFVGTSQFSVVAKDLLDGVNIGNLLSNSQKTVSFKVILSSKECPFDVVNKAQISYNYELIQGTTLTKAYESNECFVEIGNYNFKQIQKNGILKIPAQKPDIETILDLNITSNNSNVEEVSTPKGISQDGQVLTGKKLLVYLTFCIEVSYVAQLEVQSVHSAHYKVSSCEHIVVEENTTVCSSNTPSIIVEDIYFEKINNRDIFYNITYLINSTI